LHRMLCTFNVTYAALGKEKVAAAKLARKLGIAVSNDCPWIGPPDKHGFTPFGPDRRLDNIYQSLPQVTLHGMDEGLTLKLCDGVLQTMISEAITLRGMNVTSVSKNIHQYAIVTCCIDPLIVFILFLLSIFLLHHSKQS
jgi:hypothetical protein